MIKSLEASELWTNEKSSMPDVRYSGHYFAKIIIFFQQLDDLQSDLVIEKKVFSQAEFKIIDQVEYYFSNENLANGRYLQKKIKENNGWISLKVLLTFHRLAKLTNDARDVVSSLKKSESGLLEVDEKNQSIRRCPSKPLPEVEVGDGQ